jgi:fructose 1,6-bisphosphatase
LLAYLNDQTEEPAFDYARQKRNRLEDYILRERDYYLKIVRKYGRSQDQHDVKKE